MSPKVIHRSGDATRRRIQQSRTRHGASFEITTGAMQALREQPARLSARDVLNLQRSVGNRSVRQALQVAAVQRSASLIVQRDSYPYGSRNSTPHVHEYGGDCHVQIFHRGRVRRYNIIQGGQRHAQADDALEAAAGNQALLDVINSFL